MSRGIGKNCVKCLHYMDACRAVVIRWLYNFGCGCHIVFSFLYSEWVTPAALLHPLLLPKIYPPLFNLYALYNEKDDDRYWKRIRLWNKQSNLALMSYLGVDK